ncbi:ATP-binding SpoIIE family protein phosphatase [Streptomyces guryensis]|uniref:protein-serine/threonine phosphatase n=1 Tax=Streptomyces guryensis TaxID=2886947 RepID=A0A9Q3VNW0_9ACTN|nr:SpoIIE family protein phosphatase [Streptomyces guryensis]MCD9875761.1 SpoIIE family protein phosphatase [Streptomyces guryensis]
MPAHPFCPYIVDVGTDAHAFISDLARGLEPRADQLVDASLQCLRSELPKVWAYRDIAAVLPVAASEHVTTLLDFLEQGTETDVKTPPAAIELARLLAKHRVPISDLLRIYRLVQARLVHLLYEETSRLTDAPELINAATVALSAMGFEYVDRTAEQAVAAYQQERDRWLQRRLSVINEANTRIGTTLDTACTAQELADVGTDRFADLVTVDLLDSALQEGDSALQVGGVVPAHVASAVRRVAQQSVLDGCPDSAVDTGERHTYPEGSEPARSLATGQPLRHDIAGSDVPPWLAASPDRRRALRIFGIHSVLLVPLWARGTPLGLVQFIRHRTAVPFDDEDLRLAHEIASRAAVYIDNARRYTHERSTALTLQRSLLQHQVPEQSAVETACRYLPCGSRAGVGGDWYDVIPLSGARVALVVGDVVGRGLHASATMGRLRTAVRTLADIDLMPDELLTHLDDVVIRIQREQERGAEMSATCLYAVYDPVSRLCSLASAGHVPPAVVTPLDSGGHSPALRAVGFPELSIGPPLGLGGLPFETAQFQLPEGSLLVLYTDGLIQSRARDVDTAITLLHNVLARAPVSLEATCEDLLSALLPDSPTDDIALLVARTRALDARQVATLDLPSDPAFVAGARTYASDQLAAWGLEELSFTTELMVSELVTNAIRYGKAPIQLRMILQSTLTCEVSDASSTAPHLRHARVFDEGGRGLLLVAQLAERWGARHSGEGKVIWAEQALPGRGSSELRSVTAPLRP